MASPKLITKPKYGMILFLLAGALMFFFFAYSVISAPKSGELLAYSIWWLLSGCFLAFAATCVFHALRVGKVYRENGEIVFYSFLGFPIRQIAPNDITVYSANDDQYRYFLLAEYNSEANETSALWFLTLFGLIFTGVGVYEYPRRSVRK